MLIYAQIVQEHIAITPQPRDAAHGYAAATQYNYDSDYDDNRSVILFRFIDWGGHFHIFGHFFSPLCLVSAFKEGDGE